MLSFEHLIATGGLLLIAAIIFAESGMMVGFFFPGDTLLFSAGIFAAQGKLSLAVAIGVIAGAAVLGDNVGYQIGKRLGPRLFRKKDGFIFRHDFIMKAERFFEKYGSKTMLVSHFVPIVRSFAPVTAGAGKMPWIQFFIFDTIGTVVWAAGITTLGWWLGTRIPGIEKLVEPVLILVILLAFGPTIYHVLKDPKMRTAIVRKGRRIKAVVNTATNKDWKI